MKIINKKQINFFRWFLLVSGVGALWLTAMWYKMTFDSDSMAGGGNFSNMNVFYYYLFNSFVLLLSSLVFSFRFFKAYAVIAIILGISVTASLFVFENGQNLFFITTMLGMTMGIGFGGPILVPMFLGSVYIGAFRSIKHILGKLAYVSVDDQGTMFQVGESIATNNSVSSPIITTDEKSSIQKTIPIIALFYAGIKILFSVYSFITSMKMSEDIDYSYSPNKIILLSLLPIIVLIILAIASLKTKNHKVYTILNVVIVLPLIFLIIPMLAGLSLQLFQSN